MGDLKSGLPEDDPLRTEIDMHATESDIQRWIVIEEDDDVREAIVSDVCNDIETLPEQSSPEEITDDALDEEVESVTVALPSTERVFCMLKEAEETEFLCNLPDESCHLQRAQQVFLEALRESNASAQRQVLISKMF